MPAERVGLVIEDDLDFRSLVSAVVGSVGVSVRSVATGAAGVDAAREYKPDIVVLDFGLPDLNGLEVALRIREFSDVPILVLTGRTDVADSMLAAGVDEFMTKPFRVRELRERVLTILRTT
ncbi:response regulator transcription factor [Paenarthrobacter sp. RAF54_2]|uniref:response regulator transcription factor n=1 Tax=Paenarthrobacter sp. RAF54_2 TaxID=3233061 RepID=UPI003F9ADF9A